MEKITRITTFKQIKQIIEPIPANKFCINEYKNYKGQCCFLGHINMYIADHSAADHDVFGARLLTEQFLLEEHGVYATGADVNNGTYVKGYTEPIIKDRLMHMIEDGIKWEEAN